jgi:hypothetical protein
MSISMITRKSRLTDSLSLLTSFKVQIKNADHVLPDPKCVLHLSNCFRTVLGYAGSHDVGTPQ